MLIPINQIKPYDKNARKHPKKQLDALVKSIKDYGFNGSIMVDKDYTIVCGHGRFQAAKLAGLTDIECTVASHLTDEQIKQYRLVDNKVGDLSKWDTALLTLELSAIDLDMGAFSFDLDALLVQPDDYKQTKNLDNFFKADFDVDANRWGIPEITPCNVNLTGAEFISFGEKAKIKDPPNMVIHFYIDDYKFSSLWNSPDKWLALFRSCRAVVAPDFSNYTDMPLAQQLWNHYRRQWLGKYWQDNGVNVICSLSWANEQMQDWSFTGVPKHTICATSFVGDGIDKQVGVDELKGVIEHLQPSKLYIKVNKTDRALLKDVDFEVIEPYSFK